MDSAVPKLLEECGIRGFGGKPLLCAVVVLGLFVRQIVSFHPYSGTNLACEAHEPSTDCCANHSGQGSPPMFGDYEAQRFAP